MPANRTTQEIATSPLRVGVGTYQPVTDQFLSTVRQLGVEDVLLTPHRHPGFDSAIPLGQVWEEQEIIELRRRIEEHGLRLHAFEKMPIPLYEILLADPAERDQLVEVVTRTIRNLGAADVPVLGYSGHPPDGAVRTTRSHAIRGGSEATAFRKSELDAEPIVSNPPTEQELWGRYESFLRETLPVAERADVTLALHPSDPPIEAIGGIPLLFRNRENFERALELQPSDHHGLKLCLGCWSEMGEDVPGVIRHFGADQIVYVHFRDVVGTVPAFHETFIDDPASNFDEFAALRALDDVGFSGVMTPDHVPTMAGEIEWEFGGKQGRSFTVGYLRGMVRALRASRPHAKGG